MDSKGTPPDNRSCGLASVVERNIQAPIARRQREERKQTRQQRLAERLLSSETMTMQDKKLTEAIRLPLSLAGRA